MMLASSTRVHTNNIILGLPFPGEGQVLQGILVAEIPLGESLGPGSAHVGPSVPINKQI